MAKRELINTGTDKRYVRRNKLGTSFVESVDVGQPPGPPIGDSMPRPKRSAAKATQATDPAQLQQRRASRKPERSNPSSGDDELAPFIPPALCTLVPRPPTAADWVHEVKFDGWRIQIRVEDGSAKLLTRNGHDWTKKFPALAKQARGLDNCIIDDEAEELAAGAASVTIPAEHFEKLLAAAQMAYDLSL